MSGEFAHPVLSGATASVRMRQRLCRLDTLVSPSPAPVGAARRATPDDRELLLAWYEAFSAEIGEPGIVVSRVVDDRIGYGGLTLWEAEGAAVSMAAVTRIIAGQRCGGLSLRGLRAEG
jgi:hypothetical protein